jgi:hypothetical protein
MGHYLSELDPDGCAKRSRFMDRLLKLRRRINNTSLAGFIGRDFPALYRVMNCDLHHEPSESDLSQLEKRLEKKKK